MEKSTGQTGVPNSQKGNPSQFPEWGLTGLVMEIQSNLKVRNYTLGIPNIYPNNLIKGI